MMAIIQPTRVVRLLMVFMTLLLMIFIYASYNSNSVMTLPARLHASAASPVLAAFDSSDKDPRSKTSENKVILAVDRQESETYLREHFSKEAEKNITTDVRLNVTGSALASVSSSPTLSAHLGSNDLSKSLRGSTSNQTVNASVVSAALSVPNADTSSNVTIVLPSVKSKKKVVSNPVDPLRGVRTADIYETGHDDANPRICPDEGDAIKILVMITSAPKNQEARLSIRQTWGHYGMRRDVSIGFVIGRTTIQPIEDALTAENSLYGDLIRGNFIDSYNNLTLKTISILEWVDRECPRASFVLKTDDDMFINMPKLLAFVEKHRNDKRMIYGRLAKKWKPIRNQKSKYYVSAVQFASSVYPQFTTGPAYLLTSDIIHELYVKSLEQTYLKLEDVFTTGIVAQLLDIKRIHVNEFLNRRIAFNPCNIRKAISVHMIKSNEQFDLWKKLLDTSAKCK